MTKVKIETEEELAERTGEKKLVVKSPRNYDVSELEISGDLCILRGFTEAFGKIVDSSRVYKRVR